jgi:AcrR family transcriptional regulator
MSDSIQDSGGAGRGLGAPGPTTRDRLIAAGLDLFYQHGFHAVGVDRIVDAVGSTKTTFYNHFESKEALALACIEARDARWRVNFPRLLRERAGDDPINQLREVFVLWKEWFSDIHFNGCLFIHACSEFPSPNDPCHIAAKGNVDALRASIADLADDAGLDDPEGFAEQYSLLMNGAIVMEVIHRDNRAAEVAGKLANLLIEHAGTDRVG